jgi:hypothetical protein
MTHGDYIQCTALHQHCYQLHAQYYKQQTLSLPSTSLSQLPPMLPFPVHKPFRNNVKSSFQCSTWAQQICLPLILHHQGCYDHDCPPPWTKGANARSITEAKGNARQSMQFGPFTNTLPNPNIYTPHDPTVPSNICLLQPIHQQYTRSNNPFAWRTTPQMTTVIALLTTSQYKPATKIMASCSVLSSNN